MSVGGRGGSASAVAGSISSVDCISLFHNHFHVPRRADVRRHPDPVLPLVEPGRDLQDEFRVVLLQLIVDRHLQVAARATAPAST